MSPGLSPSRAIVARVTSHKDLERQVVLALEEFGLFEFIDIRQQVGIVEVRKSREEKIVYALLERLTKLIKSLGLEGFRPSGDPIGVDDTSLSGSIELASEVIRSVEKEILDVVQLHTSIEEELETEQIRKAVATSLKPLGINPSYLGETEYVYTTAGVMPTSNIKQLHWSLDEVSEGAFSMRSRSQRGGTSVTCVIVPIDLKDPVDRILTAMGFTPIEVPEGSHGLPKEIISNAEKRIKELEEESKRLEERKALLITEWGKRIIAAQESLEVERQRIETRNYFVHSAEAVKVWGWIPQDAQERLKLHLFHTAGPGVIIEFEEPDFAEFQAPSHLSNPGFMKSAQDIVTAYGTPDKEDLDPTKILFFSFPIIFGLIFADVGQGFIILLIGLAAWLARRKGTSWGDVMGYFQNGCAGLMLMGLSTMFFGFIFGSFFGAETVIEPLWHIFAHTLENGDPNPYRTTHVLKLSIEVGAIHISLGILLNLYNKLRHHKNRDALVAFSYLWLYLGFINLIFGVSYTDVGAWFSPEGMVNLWIPFVGIGRGIGNNGVYPPLPLSPLVFSLLCFMVPLAIMAMSSMVGGMDGVIHFMEYGLGMISHTVSYARIFALYTVHVILSLVFFDLLAGGPTIQFQPLTLSGLEIIPEQVWHNGELVQPFLPIVGAIVGTIIVGILEGLLAFMHTMRLHYVEWFSKFYYGGGVVFRPFTIKREFTVSAAKSLRMKQSVAPQQ